MTLPCIECCWLCSGVLPVTHPELTSARHRVPSVCHREGWLWLSTQPTTAPPSLPSSLPSLMEDLLCVGGCEIQPHHHCAGSQTVDSTVCCVQRQA